MNLLPYAIAWAVLAAVVIGLAIARMFVAGKEDDSLHVSDASAVAMTEQKATFAKLDSIDKWGKVTTVAAAVFGLALLGVYIYSLWMEGSGYVPR
jgi:hypothetical protein